MADETPREDFAAILSVDHRAVSTSIENAKVKCPECDGWKGTRCPHGCGVRLISTQAEDDRRFMAEMRVRQQERETRRAARKARRTDASSRIREGGDA